MVRSLSVHLAHVISIVDQSIDMVGPRTVIYHVSDQRRSMPSTSCRLVRVDPILLVRYMMNLFSLSHPT